MKTSIKTSATLGIILAIAGFIVIPAAQADSMSGGPAGSQAGSQSSTQAESKADGEFDSQSRGQLPDVPVPNASIPTNVTPAPAASRARTVRERQNMGAQIVEIAGGRHSRARKSSSRRISYRRPAKKSVWKVSSYRYKNGKPQKVSTTYSTKVK